MFTDEKVESLLNAIDSAAPTPGGGSASAFVGALGVALARMYGHLSVNKKKFLALDEDVQRSFLEKFTSLAEFKEELLKAYDHDCEAYDCVMAAYRLPKTTEEEIKARDEAILKATLIAIESPYQIMEKALEALHLCECLVENGNQNAISDLACGIILLDSAVQGAGLNVQINLSGLPEEEAKVWADKMNAVLAESAALKEKLVARIKEKL